MLNKKKMQTLKISEFSYSACKNKKTSRLWTDFPFLICVGWVYFVSNRDKVDKMKKVDSKLKNDGIQIEIYKINGKLIEFHRNQYIL